MKRLLLILVAVLSNSLLAFAGTFTNFTTLIPVPAQATGDTNGDTTSSSSNNIHLDARIYVPDGATSPAPVVVVIHGFGDSKDGSATRKIATDFASAGYVVLTPTVRGWGDSDGQVELVGPNEINDLKTMILAMQTGSIGDSPPITVPVTSESKFGVTGASYGGGHSFEIMRTHVAGLTAVAPIIGWTDLYQSLAPNDVSKLAFSLGLFATGFDPQNPNYSDVMFKWIDDSFGGHPERTRTGDSHENIDWRSVIFNTDTLNVPTFVIQGWRDWLFPSEQAISLFQTNNAIPFFKLYLGGLGHAPATHDLESAEAQFLRAQLLRWFDQWLKGIDTGILDEPRVTIAPEKSTDWSEANLVESDTFPLPNATTNTYFFNKRRLSTLGPAGNPNAVSPSLGGAQALSFIRSALGGTPEEVIAALVAVNDVVNNGGGALDASVATGFDDSARGVTYTVGPLVQDIHIVGVPTVQLFVKAADKNAYYFVQILERLPNGALRLVTRGAFKDHEDNFGVPHQIEFPLFAANHVFQAGSKLKVRISSRDFPYFIPNLGQPKVRILHDVTHPSSVTLPVVP